MDGKFVYQSSIPLIDVHVSAIDFIPQTSSLFIGYDFGSFVVFSLTDFSLIYSSPYAPQHCSPVTNFIYMEPDDDPKCFIYVWVARGNQRSLKSLR